MKKLLLSLSIIGMLVLASCASNDSGTISTKEENVAVGGAVQKVPAFYLNPPITEDKLYGVGSAKLSKLDASRKLAISRARDDIGFQVSTQVRASINDYFQESGTEESTQALSFVESVSNQLADIELTGAITELVEAGDDGTIYALVSFPKANILKNAQEVFTRNEDAAFAEFKASEALDRLDAQLADSPTTAGQSPQTDN